MADGELIFDNGQKWRNNSPSRKIEKPEAPEEQEEENFHGWRLYIFTGNFTIKISQLLRFNVPWFTLPRRRAGGVQDCPGLRLVAYTSESAT